ncbi:MAG: hypothetical protein IT318_10040 [Anaerolineales bacterium]|nr:hypothetical protein [Anaerolineales bacterium]
MRKIVDAAHVFARLALLLGLLGGAGEAQARSLPSGEAPSGGPGETYVAQAGDTLGLVARRARVPPRALMAANAGADWLHALAPAGAAGGPELAEALAARLAPGLVVRLPAPAGGGRADRAALPPPYPAALNHLGTPKFVLADYMLWYSPATFDGRQTFDLPAAGPYSSSSPETLRRHLAEAQRACLDGFAPHWYGPFEPVTTRNFEQLLAASRGTPMRHAALLLTNTWPGASEATLAEAIGYVLENWARHPNYMRVGGRPLLLFTDMALPWGGEAAALAGWTRLRQQLDPNHASVWMAEGLATSYNPLFEGLYVYRIDHRDYPQSWLKQPRFAGLLRALEAQQRASLPLGGLYFADSIAPGYDDTRAGNVPNDFRVPAPPFARDRRDGAYYAETFAVTAQTGGDFLLVKSFNEWVEGTAIEPGVTYGNRYLDLTCQFATEYRGR